MMGQPLNFPMLLFAFMNDTISEASSKVKLSTIVYNLFTVLYQMASHRMIVLQCSQKFLPVRNVSMCKEMSRKINRLLRNSLALCATSYIIIYIIDNISLMRQGTSDYEENNHSSIVSSTGTISISLDPLGRC